MNNSGFVLLDKPSGMTSRAAGGRVARMFGAKTFGHLGTLDPMASGLLPIALGQATKMIPYLESLAHACPQHPEKEYIFSIVWGIRTDTGDVTGKVVERNKNIPAKEYVAAACESLVGEIEQTPPAFSAVHINGRRAYELARRGEEFDIPKRKVNIYGLRVVLPTESEETSMFQVRCGAGTYVRSLALDIAEKCGTIATCAGIRRTRTGGFDIKDAVSLDFLENLYNNSPVEAREHLRPADFGLDGIPVLELNENDAKSFRNGSFVQIAVGSEQLAGKADGSLLRAYSENNFIGIGEIEDFVLKPKRIIIDG